MTDEELHSRVMQTQRRLNGRYKGLLEPSKTGPKLTHTDTVDFLHRTLRDFLQMPRIQNVIFYAAPHLFDAKIAISYVLLSEAKYIQSDSISDRMKSLLNQVSTAAKQLRVMGWKYEYGFLGHIEFVCRSRGSSWQCNKFDFLKRAVHLGHVDYVEHRLEQKNSIESVDLNSLLMHPITCRDSWYSPSESLRVDASWLNLTVCALITAYSSQTFSPPLSNSS